ncbi:MAG: SDR family NAD(P)-dependent oxidoreductase [Solirubrobacteraceae bacterium]
MTIAETPSPLRGRTALVTGASSGIGRALALRLGAAGCAVAAGYGSGRAAAEAVVAEIEAAGGRARAFGADLADAGACAALARDADAALGPVDVLVPAAGVGVRRALEDVDLDLWAQTMDVNVRAPFLLAQAIVPGMARRGFGRVLLLSSIAAFTGGRVGPHYAASKAALNALTHSLATRFAADGVCVNAIAPALIEDTQMLPGDPGELAAAIPVGRLGRPGEVAALGLAMLENGYLTGQVVGHDGGMHPR